MFRIYDIIPLCGHENELEEKMSYEISLLKLIEHRDKELYGRLLQIRKKAEALLTYTHGKFPYYTPHDFHHSADVEENLNWLIPDNIKDKMNPYEIFFLINAAWLHDWGMIGTHDEDPIKIREEHHIRTEQNFEKMYDKLNLSEHEARIIGRISKGHRKVDLNTKEYDDIIFGPSIRIRRRFLSALLRIADECDITHNRTPEVIYYSINPNLASESEFKKHLDISGIGQLDEKHKIYVSAIARDPKGAQTLREVVYKIQHELDTIKGILAQNEIFLDVVELKLETRGFIDKPIGFDINKKKIVDLLIGEHLYSNRDVAIRELIQNSIDSCSVKKKSKIGYIGKVSLIRKDDNTLVVEDNGLGMGYFEAKQFLSNIGSSLYNSEEFKRFIKEKSYDPIAQFGIGILSCFLISKSIVIETMKEGEEPCKFTIESLDEEWKYEKGSLRTPGTRIILMLNEEGRHINIKESLKRYFICPEISIEYKDIEGSLEKFNSSWSVEHINNNFIPDLESDSDSRFSQILEIHTDDYNLYFGHLTPSSFSQLILFNHGIYVGKFEIKVLSNQYCVYLDLRKNVIDLQISRENVIKNSKWFHFICSVFNNIFDSIENYLAKGDKDKFISFISNMLEDRFYIEEESEAQLFYQYPFLEAFFNRALFPVMSNGKLDFVVLKSALDINQLSIYQCCSRKPRDEIDFVYKLSEEESLIFNPYKMPMIRYTKRRGQFIDLLKWLMLSRGKQCKYTDLRAILINNCIVLGEHYPELLPENVKLAKFNKDVKPLIVVYKNPIVHEEQCYLGNSYWGNIILWSTLLDSKRRNGYLETITSHDRHGIESICILAEPIVVVDASDDFIKAILKIRERGKIDKEISDKIYRYFKYLSYLPLVIHNMASCIIFIEVLDKLEEDISKSLQIQRPKEIFRRMEPHSQVYLEYFQNFGIEYDQE